MPFSVGSLVAGYRIERVLGKGGMGTVYLAGNPVLPRGDALKVLSAELSNDPQFRARFLREADLAATLDHPNIVTVYTRGETEEGQLWIAMQYIAGSDAHNEMDEGHMTPERAVHITTEVAKALHYAHRRQLFHRDVKPANFLLANDDERVMLADFGIARALDDSIGLTMTGTVMATVAYAAPETLTSGAVDGRAVIYALGCSLYRMLTGLTPFSSAGSMAAVMAAHLTQPPPRVTDAAPHLPTAFDYVIGKSMAKDPADRYQTAIALAEAAVAALDEGTTAVVGRMPLGTAPTMALQPASTFSTPTFGPPSTGFTGGGPHADTAPPGSQFGSVAQPQPALYPQSSVVKSGHRSIVAVAAVAAVIALVGTATFLFWPSGSKTQSYQAQTFDSMNGSVEIKTQPLRVAAVGDGDADAVLSLQAQPVAVATHWPVLPTWMSQAATDTPKLLTDIDPGQIGAAKPDVVIASNNNISPQAYGQLTAISPTVTRPKASTGPAWKWEDQLRWVARIVGKDDKAQELIEANNLQATKLKEKNAAFSTKTIAVLNVTDDGVSAELSDSRIATYLKSLGFGYSPQLDRQDNEIGETRNVDPTGNLQYLIGASTSALLTVRTDKSSGSRSYNGLPTLFSMYGGLNMIIDDPKLVEAITPGGYLAVQYLNDALVPIMAQQIH